MRAVSLAVILLCVAASARATDVDWKVFGGATGDVPTLCFFDGRGVVREHNVRVWTKCLLVKEMQALNPKKDYAGRIWGAAQRKQAEHYVPPLATLEDLGSDAIMQQSCTSK